MITPKLLSAAVGCTTERAETFAPLIQEVCERYEINTDVRLAAFLAQVGHESGSFRFLRELWGPTPAQTHYEDRKSLGNVQPGDGGRYRGRGLLQTTGRANYAALSKRLKSTAPDLVVPDFEANPAALEEPRWAAMSAGDYWEMRALNIEADAQDFEKLTRKINGGLNGLEDRKQRWERAKQVLSTGTVDTSVDTSVETPASKGGIMAIPAIVWAGLQALIPAIPNLGKLFGSGSEVSNRNIQLAQTVLGVVQTATGAANAQEAVEMVLGDPQMQQKAAKAIEAQWFELKEAGGGGIEGARKMNAAMAEFPAGGLRSPAFIITCLLVLPIYFTVAVVLWPGSEFSNDIKLMVVTAIVTGLVSIVAGYWLGSSAGSARKTELTNQQLPG